MLISLRGAEGGWMVDAVNCYFIRSHLSLVTQPLEFFIRFSSSGMEALWIGATSMNEYVVGAGTVALKDDDAGGWTANGRRERKRVGMIGVCYNLLNFLTVPPVIFVHLSSTVEKEGGVGGAGSCILPTTARQSPTLPHINLSPCSTTVANETSKGKGWK